jgi:hypothetical protein
MIDRLRARVAAARLESVRLLAEHLTAHCRAEKLAARLYRAEGETDAAEDAARYAIALAAAARRRRAQIRTMQRAAQ